MSEAYVLDASAVLCLLQEEKGAERVALALPDAVIGAVNYSEVVGKLVETGMGEATADGLIDTLQLKVIPFDRIQARLAGALRADHPKARPLAWRPRLPCAGCGRGCDGAHLRAKLDEIRGALQGRDRALSGPSLTPRTRRWSAR